MFEHIVLRRAQDGFPISAGQIAEALLYYQKVHLFIDRGTLFSLIRQIGIDAVLMLLRREDVSAVYCEETLGTITGSAGVSPFYNFAAIMFSGSEEAGLLGTPEARLKYELERQNLSKIDAIRFAKKFLDLVPVRKFSGNHFLHGGITEAAKRDMYDDNYLNKVMRLAIASIPGGYAVGDDFRFEVIKSDMGFFIFTNLDLQLINRKRVKSQLDDVTIASLVGNILEARADLTLSSFYGGDFVTSDVTSAIIQARHSELLNRYNINVECRQQFVDVVLPDSPMLSEVIDSGEQSFDDFFRLLDKAGRFKSWLKGVNPDEGLVRAYLRDVSSDGWVQRLPAKSLRYVITAALEATNPTVGLVSGLIDNFLLEKLLSGWRPNHFITGKLSPFVNTTKT